MRTGLKQLRLTQIAFLALLLAASTEIAMAQNWTGSWYSANMEYAPILRNSTVRTVVHLTTGGTRLRLRFTNFYGSSPLVIGAAQVSTSTGAKIVTFGGHTRATMPAYERELVSDPLDLKTESNSELTVSVFFPERIPLEIARQGDTAESSAIIPGNAVRDTTLSPNAKPLGSVTMFLAGIDVEQQGSRGTIVVLADSMTGNGTKKWPALFAERLHAAGKDYGVVNAAIGGNRILRSSRVDYGGPSVLDRLDRDVFKQPQIKYILFWEGINDICAEGLDGPEPHLASAREVIDGLSKIIDLAHQHGIKVYVATLAPIEGRSADYYSPEKDKVRKAFNEWIRTSKKPDAVLDFDRILADSAHPNLFNPKYNWFEGHPNPEGHKALSDGIELSLFE